MESLNNSIEQIFYDPNGWMSGWNSWHVFKFIFLLQNIFLLFILLGLSSTLSPLLYCLAPGWPPWTESPRLSGTLTSPGAGRRLGGWEEIIVRPHFFSYPPTLLQSAHQLWLCFYTKIFSAIVAPRSSNYFAPLGLEFLVLVMLPPLLLPALGDLSHLLLIFHNTVNLLPHMGAACPGFLQGPK